MHKSMVDSWHNSPSHMQTTKVSWLAQTIPVSFTSSMDKTQHHVYHAHIRYPECRRHHPHNRNPVCVVYTLQINELFLDSYHFVKTSATDSTLVWLGVSTLVGKVIKTCCFLGYVVRDQFRTVFQARSRRAAYTSLWIPRVLLYHQHSITAWDYPSAITPDSTARFFRLTFWNRLPMVTIQCILCILCKNVYYVKITNA